MEESREKLAELVARIDQDLGPNTNPLPPRQAGILALNVKTLGSEVAQLLHDGCLAGRTGRSPLRRHLQETL